MDSRPQSSAEQWQRLRLWPVAGVAILAIFAISLPNLLDPFIRHDDYPALFAEPGWFWNKTLHEGRWLNYVWHLRGIVTPAWFNFAVYQILWAVLASALAVVAMGRDGKTWFTVVLALFILVATPATLISLWFNTLIPGLALVSLYAVLGCWLPQRTVRALLPLFVILSFWAYPTYALILLGVCLMRTERRSFRDLTSLVLLFTVSFAAAVLLTYALNWQVHGVFGVPPDDWREATPAGDLAGLVANLPTLAETFEVLMVQVSYNYTPAVYFHLVMLAGATVALIRHSPGEALYLHAGLWIGMALIVLQVLKLGVLAPPRTFIFAWIFYAVIVVRAAVALSKSPGLPGRIARNLSLLTVICYLLVTFHQYTIFRPWQAETRAMAKWMQSSEEPVLVYGDVMTLSSGEAANIHADLALTFRLRQLTGREVILCKTAAEECLEMTKADSGLSPLRAEVVTEKGQTFLRYGSH